MEKYLSKIKKFKQALEDRAELSWREEKTKKYIISELGHDYYWSAKTALVYKLGKGTPVFLRAEMDALPHGAGVRHACGHSAHLAALMATYLYLKDHPPLGYTIYFVFQPSEENFPSGAVFISKKCPAFRRAKVGFAFHVQPKLPAGILANPIFAAGDCFEIKITGLSAHVKDKNVHQGADAILAGAYLTQLINSNRSQKWIINVGVVNGGEASNKIAGSCVLKGDIRTLTVSDRKRAGVWLDKICIQAKKRYPQVKIKFKHLFGSPVLRNNPRLLSNMSKVLKITKTITSFGAEDFSLYPQPTVFLLIGTGSNVGLHTDRFTVSSYVTKNIFNNFVNIVKNLEKIVR